MYNLIIIARGGDNKTTGLISENPATFNVDAKDTAAVGEPEDQTLTGDAIPIEASSSSKESPYIKYNRAHDEISELTEQFARIKAGNSGASEQSERIKAVEERLKRLEDSLANVKASKKIDESYDQKIEESEKRIKSAMTDSEAKEREVQEFVNYSEDLEEKIKKIEDPDTYERVKQEIERLQSSPFPMFEELREEFEMPVREPEDYKIIAEKLKKKVEKYKLKNERIKKEKKDLEKKLHEHHLEKIALQISRLAHLNEDVMMGKKKVVDNLQEKVTSLCKKLEKLNDTRKIEHLGYKLLKVDLALKQIDVTESKDDVEGLNVDFEEKLSSIEEEIELLLQEDIKIQKLEDDIQTYYNFKDAVNKFTHLKSSDSFEDLVKEISRYEEAKEELERATSPNEPDYRIIAEKLQEKVKKYKVKKDEMRGELEKAKQEAANKNRELEERIQALEKLILPRDDKSNKVEADLQQYMSCRLPVSN